MKEIVKSLNHHPAPPIPKDHNPIPVSLGSWVYHVATNKQVSVIIPVSFVVWCFFS